MEADLKDAISALKKPNRQLVGKAIVEEAEKRIGSSCSPRPRSEDSFLSRLHATKILTFKTEPKNHTRLNTGNRAQVQVQVKATPANYRFKDAVSAYDQRSYGSFSIPPPRNHQQAIPLSSVIPSTAPRNGLRDGLEAFHIASTPVANKFQANIVSDSAAPSRPNMIDPLTQPSSPLMSRRVAPNSTTYRDVPRIDAVPSSPALPRLFATPVKQKPLVDPAFNDDLVTSTPPAPRQAATLFATPSKKAPTSTPSMAGDLKEPRNKPTLTIYQQLGWDDYDVDDLA
jgi:DNA replication regulator SLD3